MVQKRLKDKEKDIKGMQRATAEMLEHCWVKGYQAGFNDGYETGRSAGPFITDISEDGETDENKTRVQDLGHS